MGEMTHSERRRLKILDPDPSHHVINHRLLKDIARMQTLIKLNSTFTLMDRLKSSETQTGLCLE
jgi:hypothetical protein